MLIFEKSLTIPQLEKLPLPSGNNSKRYGAISHAQLASMIMDKLHASELKTVGDFWFVNPTGDYLFGSVLVSPESIQGNGLEDYSDYDSCYCLSVRNSYNGKYALSFISSVGLLIHNNEPNIWNGNIGVATSESFTKKRHVNTLDLGTIVEDAVGQFITDSDQAQSRIDHMRKIVIDDIHAYHLILKSAKEGIIPFRNCEYVMSEWGSNEQHRVTPDAYWLMLAFCRVAKKLGVPDQFEFYRTIYSLFKQELGLDLSLVA